LISPLGFAINEQTRYSGIERLVWEYARELVKKNKVTVMGHADSVYADGVSLLSYRPYGDIFVQAELSMYQMYQSELRNFDVIHDFSHQHLASRYNNLPSLNIFWHAPSTGLYSKSPYNIIALSKWAASEFKKYYHQESRVQQSIVVDLSKYNLPNRPRGNRFLTLGRMAPVKGNLNAVLLCEKARVPLDICGADSDPEYREEIERHCDGRDIRLLGEVKDKHKIALMQHCRGLIYCTTHPEVTNHKLQEAMLCGAPVIVSAIGASNEIVTHRVNGYLCTSEDEFLNAIEGVDRLEPYLAYKELQQTYSIENVVNNYIPLYEQVAGGLRW